jgi:hypothetical protein
LSEHLKLKVWLVTVEASGARSTQFAFILGVLVLVGAVAWVLTR